jgi:hypothetical protein
VIGNLIIETDNYIVLAANFGCYVE